MNFEIRKANITDIKKIQELNNKLFELEFKEFDNSLKVGWPLEMDGEEYFRDLINNHYVIVAEISENVIGYLAGSLNIQNSYNIRKIAELDNMYVHENYRKNGIGKSLIQTFIEFCDSQNMDEIKVTASYKNKNAIDFYIKNNFDKFEMTLKRKK
jgi:N-acetylglutamate synthase-like GNAT family acetyltransferase